jgi:hypothetical protein
MNFSGDNLADPVSFVNGWRRVFVHYSDYAKRLPEFNNLYKEDQICLAKRRLINIGWWTHINRSYLDGKDGLCFANGHYHPYKTDLRFTEANPM